MIEKTIVHDNGVLHYWVHYINDAKPKTLFFLHGAGVTHEMFNDQFDYFRDTYNIIAWDARWHGKSENGFKDFKIGDLIKDCYKVAENEGIKKCILIGHSMGGNISQEIALIDPQFVEKLVLIDCTKNIQRLSWPESFLISISKPLFKLCPWRIMTKISAKACSVQPEVQRYVIDCFTKMGKTRFLKVFFELYNFMRLDTTLKYPEPDDILLICGDKDKTGNIKKVMHYWGVELGEKCCIIKNAAHNSNQDQKDEVNQLIINFIAGALGLLILPLLSNLYTLNL